MENMHSDGCFPTNEIFILLSNVFSLYFSPFVLSTRINLQVYHSLTLFSINFYVIFFKFQVLVVSKSYSQLV